MLPRKRVMMKKAKHNAFEFCVVINKSNTNYIHVQRDIKSVKLDAVHLVVLAGESFLHLIFLLHLLGHLFAVCLKAG